MKRVSNKEINHENWNDEDTPEERGQFSVANSETISKRKVLSVKRKAPVSQASVFKSFGGFTPTDSSSTFNMAKNDNREKHVQNLNQLNKTFLENIQKFVAENTCCILTPLFDDYQRHLTTIKTKYPLSTSLLSEPEKLKLTEPTQSFSSTVPASTTSFFNKPVDTQKPLSFALSNTETPKTFSFAPSNIETQKPFSFAPSNTETQKPFSFAPSNTETQKPFSFAPSNDETSVPSSLFGTNKLPTILAPAAAPLFGNLFTAKPQESTNSAIGNNDEDNEEYVPPTAESRSVKEADSVFDIRCKLFYQSDSKWKEKGVGNIFIKSLSGDNKFQLVMRADNSLATILLNVLITGSMPLTVNKNNVSLVAMTDFASTEPKPTPLLIRVKTAANAEQLLGEMKKELL